MKRTRAAAPILLGLCAAAAGLGMPVPRIALAGSETAFVSDDAGVRATAMGGAYSAVGGEPTALYWNPATLFFQTERSLEASYADLYGLGLATRTFLTFGSKRIIEEPHYEGDQLVVVQNHESGTAYALGIESLSVDLDENAYSELSLGGGFAWGYDDRFAVGLALRALFASSDLDKVSGLGYNVGIGAAWQYSSRERLGISIPHLVSRLSWDFESSERLPVDVTLGWSHRMWRTLTLSADMEWREGEADLHRAAAGGEWWVFPERLAIRGGFRHLSGGLDSLDKPTFGAAVRWSRLRFDYAFRMEPEALGDSHRLGLLVHF